MKGQPLTLYEREKIELHLRGKWSIRDIAKMLHRDHSVIVRELARNTDSDRVYRSGNAHARAEKRAHRPHRKKLDQDDALRNWVIQRMREGWSPGLISGRIKNRPDSQVSGSYVSHETIYSYIYEGEGRFMGLYQYLVRKHKKRQIRFTRKSRKDKGILYVTPIRFRPKEINERREIGHWESDSIVSRGSKTSLSVQRERMTRLIRIRKVKNMTALETEYVLRSLVEENDTNLVKSITFDRGGEGGFHWKLRMDYNIDTFHADPYCSWQKGTVEQGNGLIRRIYPKGTDFSLIPDKDIYDLQETINNRPLKVLGYKTPNEAWAEFTCQLVH